jgi:diaminopimelate decarboxylase
VTDDPARHAHELAARCFPSAGGVLAVGGIPATRLAADHGTPLSASDAALLRGRLEELRAALPRRVDVYYSVKANPNPAIVRCFVEAGAGLEIASGGEYVRARAAGCTPDRILFAGPGKSAAELELVVREGIGEVHVESEEEIAVLGGVAQRLGRTVRCAARVNPAAAASGGAMRMGGQPSPFGVDEERLGEFAASIRGTPGLRFVGVHMFAGTQILDADVLVGQWRHAVAVARELADAGGSPPETVDLGGGLGIPYFAHESPLDLGAVRRLAAELFADVESDPRLRRTRFVLEPGRFLAGPAGVYLCRVVTVKRSRGTVFVVLDGGMHHHLAASGNLGQVIKRDYPILNASRPSDPATLPATIVGPLCTPLDTLGRKTVLPDTRPGDLVAVLQSGAYGLTASPVGFLSQPMPAEVLVDGGKARRIRERGTSVQPIVVLP